MVRINIINPKKLADQHLIAEYNEVLMLVGYVKKYPDVDQLPKNYRLGEGHIRFFKDKLGYLKERHENLKLEMVKRKFKPKKSLNVKEFGERHLNQWRPVEEDKKAIRKRILEKIRQKPNYYRYYGKVRNFNFFNKLIKD